MVGGLGTAPGMIRVLATPGSLTAGATVPVDAAESRHLVVRRVADGDPVQVLDGRGGVGAGVLEQSESAWQVRLEMVYLAPRPAETVLAVGGGDKDRFLLIAEKAAELGATRVVPLVTTHVHGVGTRVRDSTVDRARRRAREACKQSGSAWTPQIDDLLETDALAGAFPGLTWLLADARGGPCPAIGAHEAVGWLIGPEAGFGLPDVELLDNVLKPRLVGLAPAILRFETAAIAAMAVTAHRRLESLQRRLA